MMSRTTSRLLLLGVLLGCLLVTLAARTAQLTVLRGPDLAAAAEQNRLRELSDPAPRGLILDSSGLPLVGTSQSAAVSIDRKTLADQPDGGAGVLGEVAAALGLTVRQLRQRLTPCSEPDSPPRPVCDDGSPAAPVVIATTSAGEEQLLRLAESPGRYPGVELTATVQRTYPLGSITGGHVLGYLGEASADEVAATAGSATPLAPADVVGRGGLEQQYDADLRGEAGQRYVSIDAQGRVQATQQSTAAVPGNNLITSIDATLQARVEQELAEALRRTSSRKARGAAVVLAADTGRVLALASQPDYNPRDWVGGISERRYQQLSDSGSLVDYPVQAQVPPGSVFKPITVVAMQRKGYGLNDYYECPPDYTAGGRTFTNFESEAFGSIPLRRAIEVSCNTVFYRAGDRLWQRGGGERADSGEIDPVAKAAADFGLGRATGIDLPAESSGMVSSPAAKYSLWEQRKQSWCTAAKKGYPRVREGNPAKADYYTALDRENCRSGNRWRQGDAINAAIGQGLTTVTPLQIASAYAAIANGGRLVQPTVARAVVASDGRLVRAIAPADRGEVRVPAGTLRFLRTAMTGVPARGTAATAFAGFPLQRHPVAGKTGSAQVAGSKSTSWFASFAPADDPEYVVVVMITEGGTGGENAAPAARGIYETLFGVGVDAAFPRSGPPEAIPDVAGVRP